MDGNYFVTSGEVLIPSHRYDGAGANTTLTAEVQWTFPLDFVELVYGVGRQWLDDNADQARRALTRRPALQQPIYLGPHRPAQPSYGMALWARAARPHFRDTGEENP